MHVTDEVQQELQGKDSFLDRHLGISQRSLEFLDFVDHAILPRSAGPPLGSPSTRGFPKQAASMSAFWKSISTKCHCRVELRASGLLSRKASAQVARLAISRSVRSSLSFLSSARTWASASGLSFLRIDSATSATISWPSLPQPKLGPQPSASPTDAIASLCPNLRIMANPSRCAGRIQLRD